MHGIHACKKVTQRLWIPCLRSDDSLVKGAGCLTSGAMPYLWLLGLLAGIIIPVQTAMNAHLDRTAGHPLLTTLIVFVIGGLVCSVILIFLRPTFPELAQWRNAPSWAWGGGLIALLYVILLVYLAPRLGVGLTTTLVLVGQLLAAMLLDHFGALGNPLHPINTMRMVGVGAMIFGVILIKVY